MINKKMDQLIRTPENTELRREAEDEVLRLSYFIPQREFGLKEEDAGEFVLEMASVIENVFDNYRPESSSFLTYLYIILEHSVKRFYRKKKEMMVLESVALSEYASPAEIDFETILAERRNTEKRISQALLKKIYFSFTRIPDYRRKFFILALSYMPLMDFTSVSCICRTFRFNQKETMRLCYSLRDKCINKVCQKKSLETMRNVWWTKAMSAKYTAASDNLEEMEKYKEKFRNRVRDLDRFTPKLPYRIIAEELGLKEKYISAVSRDMRNFLIWLLDGCDILPDSVFRNKTMSRRLYWDLRNGKWKETVPDWELLPELFPSEEFACSLFTEEVK